MHLSGNFFDYFVVFGAGVLVSFTPCVYPVIPMTATFIAGINTKGSKLLGFLISLLYVFGMALTYSGLAIFAVLTGKIFGRIQNNPYLFFIVANVILFFALAMLDIIPLPTLGGGLQSKIKVKNLWTVILFGMVSGLVVGPCTAPVLGTLLLYVASKQNIFHSTSLLFVFSYGVGASLILVGTFSGIVSNLPKSGPWLLRIKQLCALILFGIAEYFLIKAGTLWGVID